MFDQSIGQTDVVNIAERLFLRRSGGSWRGKCLACGYPGSFWMKFAHGRLRLYCHNGCDRTLLGERMRALTGGVWTPPYRPADNGTRPTDRTAAALSVWDGGIGALGTLADAYLTDRCLPLLALSRSVRFTSRCGHPEGGYYPALIARVDDVAGNQIAIHRTYLDRFARKAGMAVSRASKGPIGGGAVRLDPAAPEIIVGEGIETSASAGRIYQLPAWAAINAGNLERGLRLPGEIRSVVIAADHDPAGLRAAEGAAQRWQAEGRRVRVVIPPKPGIDFNDVLKGRVTNDVR